jgi:hypothetical protein
MFSNNFDRKEGTIKVPDIFRKVVSRDGKYEVVLCVEAQKLRLERENDVVGHRKLIFTIDKADKGRKESRQVIIDFFKQ